MEAIQPLPTNDCITFASKSSLTAVALVFSVLTIFFFGLRCSRWRYIKMEIDDILLIPAALLTLATGIGLVVGAQMNIIGGHSLPSITQEDYERLAKFEYGFWSCHVLAIGFIKLSILFLFRRLFRGHTHTTIFDYFNWALIVIVALWTILFLLLNLLACGTHPEISWTVVLGFRSQCIDTFRILAAGAIISWVVDVAILIEPLFKIGSLNMKLKRKVQTYFIFLFSSLAVMAGLLRMIIWIQVAMQGTSKPVVHILGQGIASADIKYVVSVGLLWTYVEIGVGFVVASLPPCVSLIDKVAHTALTQIRSLYRGIVNSRARLFNNQSQSSSDEYTKDDTLEEVESGLSIHMNSIQHCESIPHQDGSLDIQKGIIRRIEIEAYRENIDTESKQSAADACYHTWKIDNRR